jgi:hypothetical protein
MAEPQPQPPPVYSVPQTNGLAIAGLVCGVIGLVLFWTVWVGIILGILGVIFGAVGMSSARARGGVGRGLGLAGLICGAAAILLSVLFIAAVFPAVEVTGGGPLMNQ